jgi:hypothetical protein
MLGPGLIAGHKEFVGPRRFGPPRGSPASKLTAAVHRTVAPIHLSAEIYYRREAKKATGMAHTGKTVS